RAVDLVRGDVQEAEVLARRALHAAPVAERRLEQGKGAVDVGPDELPRTADRAVDVAFGREVQDRARPVLGQQGGHALLVADVGLHEHMGRLLADRREVLEIAGVGELVDIDHRAEAGAKPVENEIGSDEAGAASDEDHCARPSRGPAGLRFAGDVTRSVLRVTWYSTQDCFPPIEHQSGAVQWSIPAFQRSPSSRPMTSAASWARP